MGKSLIFSDTMERKFLALAMKEGILHIPESHDNLIHRLNNERIVRGDISQIYANMFLNPYIKVQIIYELEFEPTIRDITVEIQKGYNEGKEFTDVFLLCSLIMARDPTLNLEIIRDRLNNHISIEEKVKDSFGSIPLRTGNNEVLTLEQFITRGITRKNPPKATNEQLLLYKEYEKSLEGINLIRQTHNELASLHRRTNFGDSVVIDPLLKNDLTDLLDEEKIKYDQFDKVDLFYLFIKELRTLPVGNSIKETIELANTREGDSLRKRVNELHDKLITGELTDINNIQKRIRDDIQNYKALTQQLVTPNTFSDLTDLSLGATSLIPGIGIVPGIGGLVKTALGIKKKRDIYQEIKNNIWVDYKGSNL